MSDSLQGRKSNTFTITELDELLEGEWMYLGYDTMMKKVKGENKYVILEITEMEPHLNKCEWVIKSIEVVQ